MAPTIKTSRYEKWFDEFVSTLRSHQIQLESEVAPSELRSFYESIFEATPHDLAALGKNQAQKHFVQHIIIEYLKEIKDVEILNLAFDYNDSEVLVWVKIKDDSFDVERKLILAEAKINAKYHVFGFDMSTTVIEESDNLTPPPHYKMFK